MLPASIRTTLSLAVVVSGIGALHAFAKMGDSIYSRPSQRIEKLHRPTEMPSLNNDAVGVASTAETTVFFLRHGRSLSNEWMEGSPENNFGAPTYNDYNGNIRDSPLSPAGIAQATDALQKHTRWLDQVELVAISPLTRCIETYLHAAGNAKIASATVPVCVQPLLRERVYTLSETGSPLTDLQERYAVHSTWDWSPCAEEEEWWYTGAKEDADCDEWRPLPAVYAVPGEPMEVFQERMEALRKWLMDRPEQCILAVAHWGVMQHFCPRPTIENCEVVCVRLERSDEERESTLT